MEKFIRIEKLLNILLYSDEFQTANNLAKSFNVSSKTIRNDLKEIKSLLIKYHLELIQKPKFGIKINGSNKNKKIFINNIKSEITNNNKNYCKRKYDILTTILLSNNRLYIDKLAKKYFVSHQMIFKDLNECEPFLKQHSLLLNRDENGIRLIGEEKNIRNALASLANLVQENRYSLDYWLKHSLDFNFNKIRKIVNKWNIDYKIYFNDVNIDNLSFHIIIMLNRVKYAKIIDKQPFNNELLLNQDLNFLKDLFINLEKELKIELPDLEKEFIKLHIIGLLFDKKSFLHNQFYNEIYKLANQITTEFITNIDKIIPLNLNSNQEFIQSLILHLLPTIYRLKLGLNLYNPLLHTIEEEYSNVYSLARIINHSFIKHLKVSASDEEIGFITLHLSLAIEKIKETVTAAIICNLHNSIIKFLLINLKKNFPYVKFVVISQNNIPVLNSVDVILTTDNYEIAINKPILRISKIISKVDIENIHRIISQNYNQNHLFSQNTVLIIDKANNKYEVLQKLAYILEQENAVTKNFINGVINREKMGNTEVGNGMVLTHGFHDDCRKTQIAFLKLNEPLFWNKEKIIFIVMMAIAKEDAKNIIQMNWLYKLLVNKKKRDEINKCQSEIDLYSIIKKEMMYE